MDQTHTLDAIIVAAYLLLSFLFGILASRILRSGTNAEEGYFLAGRKMPGWLNGISTAVTSMNADVAPAYCGMAVVVGLSVSWFYLSRFGLGMMIAAMLFSVRWRQLKISTGPEFYALRFGGRGGKFVRVYNSIFSVFIGMVPWIGAGMLGVHMIFGPIFGIEDKAITLAIILPVLLIYVWISGFAGVLITDLIQTLIIVAANIMLIIMVLKHFGGPAGLVSSIQEAQPTKFGEILSAFPVPGHRILGPLVVLAWFIVPTIGVGGSVGTEGQRVFSSKDPREGAKVWVWGEIALFAMLLLLTLPALGAIALHPEMYMAEPALREECYGLLLKDFLPVGFLGIALAALLSSVMSTIDSHMNYGAQTLLNDVYRPLVGEPKKKYALWIGRLLMLGILCCSIIVVYKSKSLIGIAVTLAGLFGSMAAFGWGQWWWWRVNFWSWLSASLAGPAIYFLLGIKILPNWDWWQALVESSESMAQSMAMLQAVLAMAIGTVVWVVVTLLTPPEKMEDLKNFYRKARPMGCWGPVRKALKADGETVDPPKGLILSGFGTAVLGSAWIALAVLAISVLFVGRYGQAALMGSASILIALAFKRTFDWHMKRLEV